MHDRLSELLNTEVIGEVTQVGDSFFDVGHGRICVDPLAPDAIEAFLEVIRRSFSHDQIQVQDQLFLEDPRQTTRGQVEVYLQDPGLGSRYRLQISSPALFEFYDRRFMIAPGVVGDLAGVLGGFHGLIATGRQGALRVLSGFDSLLAQYLERLDRTRQAALSGATVEVGQWVEEMVEPLGRAWQMLPWPLRSGLDPIANPQDRVCQHDRVLRDTVLFAVDISSGAPVYEYVHQHNELEDYDQVLGWMTEIYQAMCESYPEPAYGTVMARASSMQRFVDHFPGFKGIVGPTLESN